MSFLIPLKRFKVAILHSTLLFSAVTVSSHTLFSAQFDAETRSLCQAIYLNRLDQVNAAIQAGARINDLEFCGGASPLTSAARRGLLEIVGSLIRAGASLEPESNDLPPWTSPLVAASGEGHISVVEFLLNQGADPNQEDLAGTPIYEAARNGYPAIVELLARRGADVNKPNKYNYSTPMLAALDAYHGFSAVVRQLLRYGANVTEIQDRGIPLLKALNARESIFHENFKNGEERPLTTRQLRIIRRFDEIISTLLAPKYLHRYDETTLRKIEEWLSRRRGYDSVENTVRDVIDKLQDIKANYELAYEEAMEQMVFRLQCYLLSMRASAGGLLKNKLEYAVELRFAESVAEEVIPSPAKLFVGPAFVAIEEKLNDVGSEMNFKCAYHSRSYTSEHLRALIHELMDRVGELRWARMSPEKKEQFSLKVREVFDRLLRKGSETRGRRFERGEFERDFISTLTSRSFIDEFDPIEVTGNPSELIRYVGPSLFEILFMRIPSEIIEAGIRKWNEPPSDKGVSWDDVRRLSP